MIYAVPMVFLPASAGKRRNEPGEAGEFSGKRGLGAVVSGYVLTQMAQMAGTSRSPCHPQRELTDVPGEKYKRCPVCERLWSKGRDGRWDVAVRNFTAERSH